MDKKKLDLKQIDKVESGSINLHSVFPCSRRVLQSRFIKFLPRENKSMVFTRFSVKEKHTIKKKRAKQIVDSKPLL